LSAVKILSENLQLPADLFLAHNADGHCHKIHLQMRLTNIATQKLRCPNHTTSECIQILS